MKSRKRGIRAWVAATLGLAGLVVLIVWVFVVYNYGDWVDATGGVWHARPIEYILFGSAVVLLALAVLALLVRRKPPH